MGLGKSLAQFFVSQGSGVVICGRTASTLNKSISELLQQAGESQLIRGYECDVANLRSVEEMSKSLLDENIPISILICNAGVIGPIGPFHQTSPSEWNASFEINLKGVVNLVRSFLPRMIEGNWGRVIHISGGGASSPLKGMSSYSASKASAVRLIENLALEYQDTNVTFNSVAPGIINSRLLSEMLDAGKEKIGESLYQRGLQRRTSNTDSTEKALSLVAFLASEESSGISGKLISAEWDNWMSWSKHADELQRTDSYTLRRITGRDRGFDWGDN